MKTITFYGNGVIIRCLKRISRLSTGIKKSLLLSIFICFSVVSLFSQNEKRNIDFMFGYNYVSDIPFGFTVGISGFYTSVNLNFPTLFEDITFSYGASNGYFTGETINNSLEFIVGYSFYLGNNFIRLPVGIGMSMTDEYRLYNEYGDQSWYGSGNFDDKKVVFEAGLHLNIFNFLYVTGTYRLIGFEKSSFSIGAGIVSYSPSTTGIRNVSNSPAQSDIDKTLRLVSRDLDNGKDFNGDGIINCIDAAVSFYKWYPDKSKVRIEQNNNPKKGMNHLFNCVYINGVWRAIEPQAHHANRRNYWMRNVWGRQYDETYNRDATAKYIMYAK